MSLLNALFGSKPKKERSGSTTYIPPIVSPPAKPEQDFVILQNSDFKKSPKHPGAYPALMDLHINPNVGVAPRSSQMDTLDRVPFKLSEQFGQAGDKAFRNINRSLNEIGHRLEHYQYDFKLENSVLSADWQS